MFDENNDARWPTLVAGLILLIVLAAVAAMSAGLENEGHPFAVQENSAIHVGVPSLVGHVVLEENHEGVQMIAVASRATSERTRSTVAGRLAPVVPDRAMARMLNSLGPIDESMSSCFGDRSLLAYDLGIAPAAVFELLAQLLEASAPELHEWLNGALTEFRSASGLEPQIDLLPHLGHGIAVGLLPPEKDRDGWPFPRKIAIMRVLDEVAVAHFLDEWVTWEAGAVAPMTHGVLGASVWLERVAGFEVVGLRLDGLLPAQIPLPSPSFVVAGDYLIISPVRSAVVETLNLLGEGCVSPPARATDETVVEEIWLNFPEWPGAWLRAEPFVASVMELLGVESPVTVQGCRALAEFLGEFGLAHGTTSLTPEGGFVFQIEVEPANGPQPIP